MLLLMMMRGSFSPRTLTIINTYIRCVAYFLPLHRLYKIKSNLSGNAHQKSPVSSVFQTSFSSEPFSNSGNCSAQDSKVSPFSSQSSPATLNYLTLCLVFHFSNHLFDAANSATYNLNAIFIASSWIKGPEAGIRALLGEYRGIAVYGDFLDT